MKYVSIDIETSGLNPKVHKILSVGAIIEDTDNPRSFEKCPKFHAILIQRDFPITPKAAVINATLLENISLYLDSKHKESLEILLECEFLEEWQVAQRFYDFLTEHLSDEFAPDTPVHITAAGKNFASFDRLFLEQLPRWQQLVRVRHRVIDPAVLYVDWHEDKSLPSLDECKKRAGIDGKVKHNALSDAWDVIQVLRNFYAPLKKIKKNGRIIDDGNPVAFHP